MLGAAVAHSGTAAKGMEKPQLALHWCRGADYLERAFGNILTLGAMLLSCLHIF